MPQAELTLAAVLMDKFEKANEGVHMNNIDAIAVVRAYAAIATAEAASAQVAATHAQTEQLRRLADAQEAQVVQLEALHNIQEQNEDIAATKKMLNELLRAWVKRDEPEKVQ